MSLSCRVFVGNIPYEATEDELVALFSRIGRVVSFKLLPSLDKKKASRGYGFCEFADPQDAATALKTMSGTMLHGRALRVDHADADKSGGGGHMHGWQPDPYYGAQYGAPGVYGRQPQQQQQQQVPYNPYNEQYDPFGQQGSQSPPVGVAPGVLEVNKVIDTMTSRQLEEVVERSRALAQQSPEMARKVLLENPQLAFAMLQAHVSLGLLDANSAQSMLRGVAPIAGQPQQAPGMPQMQPMAVPPPPPAMMAQPMGQPPMGQPLMGQQMGQPMNQQMGQAMVPYLLFV